MTLEALICVKVGAANITADMVAAGHLMIMIGRPFFEYCFTGPASYFFVDLDTVCFFRSHIEGSFQVVPKL